MVDPKTGNVTSLKVVWGDHRKYPLDMAQMVISTSVIQERSPRFKDSVPMGFLETTFVEQVIDRVSDLEPLANNCTSVYIWHVKTDDRLAGKEDPFPEGDTEADRSTMLSLLRG